MDQDQVPSVPTERVRRVLLAHNAPDLLYRAIVAGSVLAIEAPMPAASDC